MNTKKVYPERSRGGFTLIELLVVIFIIGLLAAIITVSVNGSRQKTRDARRISDISSIRDAVELYADAHAGKYPIVDSVTSPGVCATYNNVRVSTAADWASAGIPGLVPTYTNVIPLDPRNSAAPVNYTYQYLSCATGAQFKIFAYTMESDEGKAQAGADGGSRASYEAFSSGAASW